MPSPGKSSSRPTRANTRSGRKSPDALSRRETRQPASKPVSPALKHLFDRLVGNDAGQRAAYEEHLCNAEIARQIYELRGRAKLSQRALAKLVGTTASAICRLEDADYAGHSVSMLRRIAAALDRRIEIRFLPARRASA